MGSAVTDAPPNAYERHVGRYGRELAAGMIGVAALRRGQRALDVGCGPGALTQALAALLGPENVAAIDPSEAFAATCRERVPESDVRVGVAEELPFPDGEFDVVLAQLVVDGMDDARRGVAEMRRVARPSGVLAACVWKREVASSASVARPWMTSRGRASRTTSPRDLVRPPGPSG